MKNSLVERFEGPHDKFSFVSSSVKIVESIFCQIACWGCILFHIAELFIRYHCLVFLGVALHQSKRSFVPLHSITQVLFVGGFRFVFKFIVYILIKCLQCIVNYVVLVPSANFTMETFVKKNSF